MITIEHEKNVVGDRYSLRMEVTACTNMSIEVFLYKKTIDNTLVYCCVASVDQIRNGPEHPFEMKSSYSGEFASAKECDEFMAAMIYDITELEKNFVNTMSESGYGEIKTEVFNEDI